ncbi:MAG TPA: hypothetical protein VFB13_05355 [Reyranella sp.]|jgi:hypothetical protein|nr:hypothetical protein [Reyranella sp.]
MPDTLASPLVSSSPLERIRAARRPLGWRRRALALCEAEVAHARADFWRLARALRVDGAFDRFLDPACHEAASLPHEHKAGRVLLWLSHLQVEEQEIAKSIGMGMLRSDRRYMRSLFRRRLALKQGLRQSFAAYSALRPPC